MKNIFSFLLIITFLNGCQDHIETCHSYIGGEIINPTDNRLTIFKSNSIIDTIRLDLSLIHI